MHVTIVSTWFPTEVSAGLGIFVARHAASMAAAGHDIRVVHLVAAHVDDGTRRTRVMGVPVIRLPMTPSRPHEVLAARRALGTLTAGSDIVHTHAISTLMPYALSRPREPWLHTEHWSGLANGGAALGTIARAGAQVVLRLERRPDVVTTVSDQLAADLRAYRPHGEILTVPNEVTRPSEPAPRRDIQLGRDVLQIVGVGGLIERKRPDLAVAAVAALAELGVPARLTWVGDGPLAEHCTALAQSLNVDLELTGQLPDDVVGEVLSASDLFLVPTLAETFFLGAAEALAAGRPVVTSDRGAHTSFLDPSVAEIVSQDDPLTWARAVIEVMRRCEGLTAQDIQDTLPRAFSPEEVAGAYGRAYEAAISVYSRHSR
nr:glycosyltransferase [Actinomyces oris]